MTKEKKKMLLARLESLKILLGDPYEIKISDDYQIKNLSLAGNDLIGVIEDIIADIEVTE